MSNSISVRKKATIISIILLALLTSISVVIVSVQESGFSTFFERSWQEGDSAGNGLFQSERIWNLWVEKFPVCEQGRVSEVFEGQPALREMPWGEDVELICADRDRIVRFSVTSPICEGMIEILGDQGLRFALNGKMVAEPVAPKECMGTFSIYYPSKPYPEAGLDQADAIVRQWREISPTCENDESADLVASHQGWETSSWGGGINLGCVARKRSVSFQTWPPICGDFVDFLQIRGVEFLLNGKIPDLPIEEEECSGAVAIIYPPTPYAELGLLQTDSILRKWRRLSPACDSEETDQLVAAREDWSRSIWGGRLEIRCERGGRVISFEVWPPICESFAGNLSASGQFFLLNGVPLPDRERMKACTGVISVIYPIAPSDVVGVGTN